MAAANEDALSQRLLEIEYVRRELEEYLTAINSLQLTQESINKSLEGLTSLKNGAEAFIPYSQDILFKGRIEDTDKGLVNIGSNIFKSLTKDKIRDKLEADLKEVGDNINKLAQMVQSLQQEGSRLEQEANRMYEEYRTSLQKS